MGLPVFKLGLVGAGTESAMAVLQALRRQPRLLLAEIFDPCIAAGQANALQLETSFAPSLESLLIRTQAVVLSEVKWMGIEPVLRATEREIPTLILSSALSRFSRDHLMRIREISDLRRTMIMPELTHRWARSTLRLRELTATQAGAIEALNVHSPANPFSHSALMVFDWCSYVMQSECRIVQFHPASAAATLEFRRLSKDSTPVKATIHFGNKSEPSSFPVTQAKITCRHGQIQLLDEETLEWEIDRRKVQESLTSDRSASDVMCDLFGRRLAGGLVPVPEILDLIRAHAINDALETSRKTKQEVPVKLSHDFQ